jgi:hypothetical protein
MRLEISQQFREIRNGIQIVRIANLKIYGNVFFADSGDCGLKATIREG